MTNKSNPHPKFKDFINYLEAKKTIRNICWVVWCFPFIEAARTFCGNVQILISPFPAFFSHFNCKISFQKREVSCLFRAYIERKFIKSTWWVLSENQRKVTVSKGQRLIVADFAT